MCGGIFFGALGGLTIARPNFGYWEASRIAWTIGCCVALGLMVSLIAMEIALRMRGGDDVGHTTQNPGGGNSDCGLDGLDE